MRATTYLLIISIIRYGLCAFADHDDFVHEKGQLQ